MVLIVWSGFLFGWFAAGFCLPLCFWFLLAWGFVCFAVVQVWVYLNEFVCGFCCFRVIFLYVRDFNTPK